MRHVDKKILLSACCAGLALGGCDLAPHYQRPPMETSAPFKEAVPGPSGAGQGWRVAEPNDDTLRGSWWELYRDPQLNELEKRVAISNQTVAAAEANYRAAHALVLEAQAGLFPSLVLAPSVIRSRSSASVSSSGGSSGSPSSGGGVGPKTTYTLPVDASYEVDLWGSVRNAVAQNSYAAQASAADVETALLSTHSALAQAYFALRAADEQRRILDTTLADYEASLHLVRTLYNNGLASEEDLAEADTQLDNAEAQATDLGIARAQYEHAIAVLIGVPPALFSVGVRPFSPQLPELMPLPATGLIAKPAASTRPVRKSCAVLALNSTRPSLRPSSRFQMSSGRSFVLKSAARIGVSPRLSLPIPARRNSKTDSEFRHLSYQAGPEIRSFSMPALSPDQANACLASVPEWEIVNGELVRTFQFKDFRAALGFVDRVGELAEEAGHHPDIDIRYNRVRLALVTHDVGGLTAKDFDLASRADSAA